jgi:O-antigen ligase
MIRHRPTIRSYPLSVAPVIEQQAERESSLSWIQIVAFLVFNVLLAYLSRQSNLFSSAYGWGVLLIGIFWLMRDKQPVRIMYLCTYLVGAELVWRATGAGVFYEFGKYAITFLLILAILKFKLLPAANKWPILYFVLLLPSIFLLPSFDRQMISFFLSGPFLLAVSVMFFSTVKISLGQLKRMIVAVLGPTVGIAFLALFTTFTAADLTFSTQSNFTTSGGFGPVQVSLQLGFGALLAFYYAISEKRNGLVVITMLVLAIWLISQSVFTFSRSGLYNTVGALLAGAFFLFREPRQRIALLVGGALSLAVFVWMIFPALDDFTEGRLGLRYQDTRTSGRETLIRADWQAFIENPLLGVGPGQARFYHGRFGIFTSSHTEYTRLLSEHGSLGLVSLLILLGLAASRVFKKMTPAQKGIVILLTVWAMLYMLNTTMRTAAPGFLFGLAGATFLFDEEEKDVVGETRTVAHR